MKKLVIFLIAGIFMISLVSAHQPRIISSEKGEKGVNVIDPEISKAYYSGLKGKEHQYIIDSDEEFNLYVGILIPGREITHTVSVEVIKDNETFALLDGENFEWWEFYEEFGKDYYMAGPELGVEFKSNLTVPAGIYDIRVFNGNNWGEYSLAIGDLEEFGLIEVIKAFFNVIRLKIWFF